MTKHNFKLFADYFQFYLMDPESSDDTSEIWTDEALDFKLGLMKNTIAIGTFRNVDVDVEIEIHEAEPTINLDEWDYASNGYFTVNSGSCAVFGCTDYMPDAAMIDLPKGRYAVLSLAKGLDTITNEWEEADDLYRVLIWPSDSSEYGSLKRYDI